MARAYSMTEVSNAKYQLFDFNNTWLDAFARPERTGVWFIWGGSGSGKTTFVLELVKYLSQFEKVIYNSLEEGKSYTMKCAIDRVGLPEIGNKVQLLDSEPMSEFDKRLETHKSRKIAVVDSIQYTGWETADYMNFTQKHSNKLLIFTSQAKGSLPLSDTALKAMFDADLKIWVEGYKAFSKGRYIGTAGEYTIWNEGAEKYWGITG